MFRTSPRVQRLLELNEIIAGTAVGPLTDSDGIVDLDAITVAWLKRTASWRAERDAILTEMETS